tara:strand:+ start:249 stop:1259 length:1011 start_codon:yes stop_codon:yes gene_type:complete
MLITYIRSSSYNNYSFCQQQYYINYVLGYPSVSGKKAQMGTIVHKVMECLARSNQTLKLNKRVFTDDVLGKISVGSKKLQSDDFINELVDKSFNHYTSNCKHEYSKKDYNDCNKWTWMGLGYNNGQFDPRNLNIIAAEPHFDIKIDEPWAKYSYSLPDGSKLTGTLAIKGTIDLVTEPSSGVLEVIDWKTGRRIDWATGEEKDYDKLLNDPQLLLYNYAISKMFPEYEQSITSIFYIKDGGPFSLCFDESDQKSFLEKLRTRFSQVKNNENPKMISRNQSNWKCTKLCDYFKNNWPGTDTNMCKYIHEKIEAEGIDKTTEDCTREGFSIGYYDAPG